MPSYEVTFELLDPDDPIELERALIAGLGPKHVSVVNDYADHWEVVLLEVLATSFTDSINEAIDTMNRAVPDFDQYELVKSFVVGGAAPEGKWSALDRANKLADEGERGMAVILLQTAVERTVRWQVRRLTKAQNAADLFPTIRRNASLMAPEARGLFLHLTGVDPSKADTEQWAKYKRHVTRRGVAAHGGVDPVSSEYAESCEAAVWMMDLVTDATKARLAN